MTADTRIEAVQALIALTDRERARGTALEVFGRLTAEEALRAADGAQQLARALASLARSTAQDPGRPDAHDVRSLYS